MEINFTLRRLAVLTALIGLFWLLGGFSNPGLDPGGYLDSRRITKAWTYCIILYLAGAGSATIVDHFAGNLDRSNLRLIYIILGVLLMLSSLLWLHVLREGVEETRAEKTLLALAVRHDSAPLPEQRPHRLELMAGKDLLHRRCG